MTESNTSKITVLYEELARKPFEETERIFKFFGWQLSEKTRHHIYRTTNEDTAQEQQYLILKSADVVLNRWKENISTNDYSRVSHLLASCQVMEFWDENELVLQRHPHERMTRV